MSSEWIWKGIDRRDFRNSDRLEDWEPTKYRHKSRRIKGKRVCGRDRANPCEFTTKARVWSWTTSNGTTTMYVNACHKCGRHGFKHEKIFIEHSQVV